MAPIRENLLFDPHPASKIPTTPILEAANRKNTPTLKFSTSIPLFIGRHAKVRKEAIITMNGAKLYRNWSAPFGLKISLVSIFRTSQITCMEPHGPTRIGPRRHWKNPHTLRSIYISTMARRAYINMIHTPIATHSMNTAHPSGMTEVSIWCLQFVIILKSNMFFLIYDFLIYERMAFD